MKIRDDLDGVVYVSLGGDMVVLQAGDDVPEGAEVGDHLTESAKPAKTATRSPAKGASAAKGDGAKGYGDNATGE